MKKIINAEAMKKRDPDHRALARKLDSEPAACFCEGCKWERDPSCCCHGGKGYEPADGSN